MEKTKIPPKSEWRNLSINQLYDVKSQMSSTYYDLKGINASFAGQYLQFMGELEGLIRNRETAEQLEREKEQQQYDLD
jgi:hypothetical protein